ncbi:hypothetical protein A3A71_01720 [Candidatus Berkelbacteria bacterium RIFCSPLOWO2_01_FULL_50_28]|uniref:Uncharacterized protein n=1 Tax=Candidatus Berkelbacteria bacterium RIFCSPLOWO2_01_FULL_50_28 TaxID=1797471 RepID=A0A1F5EBM4_9BACT|nr:MAG: hypothetical protein A3F39_01565 [Candidatus Berkelbacteria bacterium RIFCSPHIGHO2_12_FULL_50_11]OGD64751.1 MAG: hypothetical protein A3A71_01720 [Candidatus Berkelbacteria bacterium RIFCSPLOWO2_01_FULL_50_28]
MLKLLHRFRQQGGREMAVRTEFEEYLDPTSLTNIFPRVVAAEILAEVATYGESGNSHDIPPYLVGRAISRLAFNYRSAEQNDPALVQKEIFADFLEGLEGVPRTRPNL